MISVTELRAGAVFKDSQGSWEVMEYKHVKMGRGSATIRVKVRNLKTANIVEKTFTSGQRVEDVEVGKKKGQFLYESGKDIIFMDPDSYEQFSISKDILENRASFFKEGDTYDLLVVEDQIISVTIPKLVVLTVSETGPGVKGDSVSNVSKDAILENGLQIKVPLFINQGDKIKIDTRTLGYVERVKR